MDLLLDDNFIIINDNELVNFNGGGAGAVAAGVFVGCLAIGAAPLIGVAAAGAGAWAAVGAGLGAVAGGAGIIDESLKWR